MNHVASLVKLNMLNTAMYSEQDVISLAGHFICFYLIIQRL